MIKSITIVSYRRGGVLFSRFYTPDLATLEAQALWLSDLRDATMPEWSLLADDGPEQVAKFGAVSVMYKLIGDVVVIFAGTVEHDALLLLELARAFEEAMRKVCRARGNASVEKRLVQSYSDLCLVVDEMIDQGFIDHLDPKLIQLGVRMNLKK